MGLGTEVWHVKKTQKLNNTSDCGPASHQKTTTRPGTACELWIARRRRCGDVWERALPRNYFSGMEWQNRSLHSQVNKGAKTRWFRAGNQRHVWVKATHPHGRPKLG